MKRWREIGYCRWAVWGALLCGGAAGCAPTAQELEMRRLAQAVELMQQQMATSDRRLDELSGRLVAASGELKAVQTKIATQQQPALEVVKLAPLPHPQPQYDGAPYARVAESWDAEPPFDITMDGTTGAPMLRIEPVPPPPGTLQKDSKKPNAKKASRRAATRAHRALDEQFSQALAAFREGKFAAASELFAAFIEKHPQHARADDAVFWLGECRFEQKDYLGAVTEYTKLLERYPKSSKLPDALMKTGVAHEQMGRSEAAREAFVRLVRQFPATPLADLARTRLPPHEVSP